MVNNFFTKKYCELNAMLDFDEERGVEAIEWIAMAAAILILLTAVGGGLKTNGDGLGAEIVKTIKQIVTDFFKFKSA